MEKHPTVDAADTAGLEELKCRAARQKITEEQT